MNIPALVTVTSACCVFLLAGGCANIARRAEIAGFLLAVNSDQKEKEASNREETANFEKAKLVLLEPEQRLSPLEAEEARNLFGEPVSVSPRERGGEVWGYKPSSSDWFKGEKIFLSFDDNGRLCGAEYIPS